MNTASTLVVAHWAERAYNQQDFYRSGAQVKIHYDNIDFKAHQSYDIIKNAAYSHGSDKRKTPAKCTQQPFNSFPVYSSKV